MNKNTSLPEPESDYGKLLAYLHEQFPATIGHMPLSIKVYNLYAQNERLVKALEQLSDLLYDENIGGHPAIKEAKALLAEYELCQAPR